MTASWKKIVTVNQTDSILLNSSGNFSRGKVEVDAESSVHSVVNFV